MHWRGVPSQTSWLPSRIQRPQEPKLAMTVPKVTLTVALLLRVKTLAA